MEVLHILEEKIARLIESKKKDMQLIVEFKKEIAALQVENGILKSNIEKIEDSLLTYDKNAMLLSREREEAKNVVDDLIGCIDDLIGKESAS